jgi:hypothetical protein
MRGINRCALIVAVLVGCGSNTSNDDSSALDERTCEIGRDIAGSYQVTDTLEESRQRVADLYSGYGVSASIPIQSALRQWVSGMTTGNYRAAAQGVAAFDAACDAIAA